MHNSSKLIPKSFESTSYKDRQKLLTFKPDKINYSGDDNLYAITIYHPTFNMVNKVVAPNMDFLDKFNKSTCPAN